MVENREFVRFLSWTSAIIVIGAAMVMTLVFVVDPYRIYRFIDQPGFNHIKPAVGRYQEEIKITGARTIKANAFILGNSRAEIGFNPDYTGFAQAGLFLPGEIKARRFGKSRSRRKRRCGRGP